MNSFAEKEFTHPFFLSQEGIVKIQEIIQKRINEYQINSNITIKIFRVDHLVYETNKIDDLINEENSTRNSLKTVEFLAKDNDFDFVLRFDEKKSVFLKIESNHRDKTFLLFSDISSYLETRIITTSRIERFINALNNDNKGFFLSGIILTCMISLAFILFLIFLGGNKSVISFNQITQMTDSQKINFLVEEKIKQNKLDVFFPIIMLILFPTFGLIFAGTKILQFLFPGNTFYIGENIKKFNQTKELRKNIFWVIFVGLIVSIIGSIIYGYFPFKR